MIGARTAGLILTLVVLATPTLAAQGDPDRGESIYFQRCVLCHGEDGDGAGPAEERLNPPPRDFTLGLFKIKTTGFDDPIPNDADLERMIRDGMPGTSMPGWADLLSEQDILDLIAYIKILSGLEEEEPVDQVDYGTQTASSPESIAIGKQLFLDGDRCSECHGTEGKGDAIKKLKDDNGARTWPRNLTKPWTFRASNDPKDIFTRISVGIPSTQMPSFADPVSKKKLTIEERWQVANYVASIVKAEDFVRPENTVIKAEKIAGEVPTEPDDPQWQMTEPTTFFLLPQIIAEERLFTPTNDTIKVRALYNETYLALLLEWDDRTRSIPGDAKAESLAEGELAQDRVSVQLPVKIPEDMEKPYFGMGDASQPVNLWQWSSGTITEPESVVLLNGRGFADQEIRDAAASALEAQGAYRAGTWRVIMRRPLAAADPDSDVQLIEGVYIPIAFAVWDGSNAETGSKHTLTTWYWLLLKPPTGLRPVVVALLVAGLIGAGEIWWARSARPTPVEPQA